MKGEVAYTISIMEREDGRFEGALFVGSNVMIAITPQDRPEQIAFGAYSYLVHERNGDLE